LTVVNVHLSTYNRIEGGRTSPLLTSLSDSNARLFIIGNGQDEATTARFNAFEVSSSGHSIVYHTNGSGGATPNGGLPVPDVTKGVIKGATYTDNVIYAWGTVQMNPGVLPNQVTVLNDFGVAEVRKIGVGVFQVTLNPVDPYSGTAITLASAAVTANIRYEGNVLNCGTIYPSGLAAGTNQFMVRMMDSSCEPKDFDFTFHVCGRP
jgi:hypothetical protein